MATPRPSDAGVTYTTLSAPQICAADREHPIYVEFAGVRYVIDEQCTIDPIIRRILATYVAYAINFYQTIFNVGSNPDMDALAKLVDVIASTDVNALVAAVHPDYSGTIQMGTWKYDGWLCATRIAN
jgi:hypothetical protein